MLASNQEDQTPERINVWEEPEALVDIAFVAGVLGLFAGLMAVVRLSGSRFPDAFFWRLLPLLLVLPPAVFLSPLLAPGGLFAFTVETHSAAGVALGEKLRFAHGADHVRSAVEAAGLWPMTCKAVSTRTESGVPVPGLMAVAERV